MQYPIQELKNIITDRIHENHQRAIDGTDIQEMFHDVLDSLSIQLEANQILSRYHQLSILRGYLFPILDNRIHKTAIQKQNRILKLLSIINKDLKRIADLAEIKMNLSTYVARHSFATILKNSGVNISLISEVLGHSELSTTMIYLDSFENSQMDEAMKCLL